MIAAALQRPKQQSGFELGLSRLTDLQHADGHWEAEVLWSPVITAQAVIVHAITGRKSDDRERLQILRYFCATSRPGGGWGLHPESNSFVFVTTLVYIACRLLGARPDDPMLADGRAFLLRQPGGVAANPQWGRFWLAIVGLCDWRDLNACPPEFFLLPRTSALSPLRFYCHTRYIYLAMAYLSGIRFASRLGSIVEELREELQLSRHARFRAVPVAAADLHESPGTLLRAAFAGTRLLGPLWQAMPGASRIRRKALASALDRIRYEQRVTRYQSLSPVSGLLNTLALWANDPGDPDVVASLDGADFWRWDDDDGVRYAGARSVSWDTSFALQALVRGGGGPARAYADAIRRGYRALATMQATTELPDRIAHDRDINLGGWCFTEGQQAWPVSDCTAEAVVALLDCEAVDSLIPPAERVGRDRLALAAAFILSRQNDDGGFGSYERRRGAPFLERLNPSEMFGRCMTELSYVECTASSIRALHRMLEVGVPFDLDRLRDAIRRGTALVLSRQNPDGSWPGFWGINIVYGTLFAIHALREVGMPAHHSALVKARRWIEAKQKADGGWGEHFAGCATGTYVDNPHSQVITTAWATMALLEITDTPSVPTARGLVWLRDHQQPDGDWPRDSVNGVFFGTAMLDYRLYNTYFPLMALAGQDRHANA